MTPLWCPDTDAKSISSEETFEENTNDFEVLRKELLAQAEEVGRRLRRHELKATTVTLKLRRADFDRITRSISFSETTDSTKTLYECGLSFSKRWTSLRNSGSSALPFPGSPTLRVRPTQLNLFAPEDRKRHESWREVEKAMDSITEKFGRQAIKRGSLIEEE